MGHLLFFYPPVFFSEWTLLMCHHMTYVRNSGHIKTGSHKWMVLLSVAILILLLPSADSLLMFFPVDVGTDSLMYLQFSHLIVVILMKVDKEEVSSKVKTHILLFFTGTKLN